jgi:L-malate glycosyltransferase
MRIAVIAHTNAPWTGPYARHLRSSGHDVLVLSFSPEPLEGVEVAHVDRVGFLPRGLSYLAGVPRVRRLLRSFSPDVILATYLSSNGLVAALSRRRVPLVVSARGGDVLEQAGYLPGGELFHGSLMRFVCRRASAVHAVSGELVEALVEYGIDPGRIECFPVGIDVARFSVRPVCKHAGEPLEIVCTRRQEPVYSNETVVDALAQLHRRGLRFRATLVGGGALLDERRAQISALGLDSTTVCTGHLPLEAVHARLRQADIYVSASASDGTSSSLLEGMAAGLFPVVSSIRANEDWIRDGSTGLLFDVGNPSSLAAALERALVDERLRANARGPNRALVESRGNHAVTLPRMERLLQDAVG